MKIEKFKKFTKGRYKLSLDNKQELILYEDVILKYNLLIRKEIDDKLIKEINKDNYYSNIYNDALRYINIKMRSEKELRELLNKKYNDEEIINKTLDQLLKEGYINDIAFCKSYISDRLRLSNDGIYKIKSMLSYYNIDDSIIEQELMNVDISIVKDKLHKLIDKYIRINNKCSTNNLKNKTLNHFINLGYDREMIIDVFDTFDIKQDDSLVKKEYYKYYNKYSKKYSGYKLESYIKSRLFQKGYSLEEIEKVTK